MEIFEKLFAAVQSNGTAALLVLCVGALVYVFKDARKREDAHAAEIAAAHAAHLATALQVAPLASKLVTCVEVLERLSQKAGA